MPEPIRLQSTGVILVNPQGQILLQQRDDKPGLPFPNCWTTFGGAIEDGETPDEAIRRELLEEIGLDLSVKLWKRFDHVQRNGQIIVDQYMYVGWIDLEPNQIILNEGQALGYFSESDINHMAIAFGFEALFKEFFEVKETLL